MGCGQSSVASDRGNSDADSETKDTFNVTGVKKEKKDAKRRRSASGLLENLVHEEFDKGESSRWWMAWLWGLKSTCVCV